MKNLKINKSISTCLKNNKIKISAISLTTVIITTCGIIVYQNKIDKNNSTNKYNQMLNNIETCLNNSSNIEVTFKNGIYTITEYKYKETPIYNINENGEKIIENYEKVFVKSNKYSISAKQAEELDLTSLLESQLNNEIKTK